VETPETDRVITGVGAAGGVVEGRACVVLNADDFSRVKRGSVIVTHATSAAFNAILPFAVAIVADYGVRSLAGLRGWAALTVTVNATQGLLSHAAIVSREMGIPCVVRCVCMYAPMAV
jgi:phosphoenolpyruvate synthase/pyruvate phosphate dikinase